MRAATANHIFKTRSQKSNKDNDLSALKQFASDQLTLISQKEYASQMHYMDQFDDINSRQRMANGRVIQKVHSNRDGRMGMQHTQDDKNRTRSVYAQSKQSAKEKLQQQFFQSSNGFRKNNDRGQTTQLKRFGKQIDEEESIDGRPYDKNIAKQKLCRAIRDRLRKELWYMYRSAEQAYGSFDFSGLGYITEQAFLDSKLVKNRVPYSNDEIRLFFRESNLFDKSKKGLEFDTFKKYFFPHLYLVQDDPDDAEDNAAMQTRNELKKNSEKQPQVIEDRVVRLENKLKTKFSNCFESVRKAFLALDSDYDGIITVEDILKYFGNETDLNYNDLKKLINDKDSKKQGKLGYMDFSKWLGNAIHMSEGFYFRHDSVKNPQYEGFLELDAKLKADDKVQAQRALMIGDIEAKILEKIKFQWKTLRKAFMDLNIEKTGRISRREFKFYLNFWGMDITDEEFEAVYNKFDLDKDGVISYKDFQISIGSEMFPAEGLYFRQDIPQQCKTNVCQHPECWQPTKSNQNFCVLHQKMHQDEAIQIYTKIFKNLGSSWTKFIETIKKAADPDDESQIVFSQFCKICDQFNAKISTKEKKYLLEAFPGKEGGADVGDIINVARIYDQKYSIILGKMYNKVNMEDFEGTDEPMDPNGYLGKTKFYRPQVKTTPITQEEFINIIAANDRLKDVMGTIKEIDKDHNGYVTATELDDILKLYYPETLNDRELIPHIKKFSSIQNRILIDYKEFRDWIKLSIANIKNSNKDSKSQQLKDKIQNLENRVKVMKKREQELEHNLKEYSDIYYSNKDGISQSIHSRKKSNPSQNQNRAKSCISGKRPRGDVASGVYNQSQSKSKQNILSEANLKRSMMSPRARSGPKTGTKSHRPSTSGVGSRKMSISKRLRDEIDCQNFFGEEHQAANKTNKSESKFVSINQLMKQNNQGPNRLNQTLHYKGSEDDLEADHYQTLQAHQGRSITSLHNLRTAYNNFDERQMHLKHFKEGQILNLKTEDDLIKGRLRNIQPTDERTMNKILNFAQTINAKIDDTSPKRNNNKNSYSNTNIKNVSPALFRTAEYSHRRMGNDSQSRLGLSDSKYSANKSVFARSKFEKLMIHKLGYEWKNIYRTLTTLDPENLHVVTMQEFSQACDKHKVSILKQELEKLQKIYGAESSDFDVEGVIEPTELADFINYKRLSIQLGLHKDSYNYLNSLQHQQRMKNVSRLRNLYKSIESPTARHHTEELDNSLLLASAPNPKGGRSLMTRNVNHKSATGIQRHESTNNEVFDKREMQSPYSNALNRGIRSNISKKALKEEQNLILAGSHNNQQRTMSTEHRQKLGARYIVNDPFKNEKPGFKNREEELYKINLKDQVKFMSKRHSYNGKQKEVLNRLAEGAVASNQSNKTTDVTDGHFDDHRKSQIGSSIYDESIKTNLDDAQISKLLSDKQKLKQFRDLVIIQLKKNDIQQKIIANEFQTGNNSDIVLPKSNFKQCLQAIGAHLSHEQMQRFAVRGDISLKSTLKVIPETAQEHKESNNYEKGGRNKQSKSQTGYRQSSVKVRSLVNDAGPRNLGYNVQKFIQFYLN